MYKYLWLGIVFTFGEKTVVTVVLFNAKLFPLMWKVHQREEEKSMVEIPCRGIIFYNRLLTDFSWQKAFTLGGVGEGGGGW
jgi:hypothetical protein